MMTRKKETWNKMKPILHKWKSSRTNLSKSVPQKILSSLKMKSLGTSDRSSASQTALANLRLTSRKLGSMTTQGKSSGQYGVDRMCSPTSSTSKTLRTQSNWLVLWECGQQVCTESWNAFVSCFVNSSVCKSLTPRWPLLCSWTQLYSLLITMASSQSLRISWPNATATSPISSSLNWQLSFLVLESRNTVLIDWTILMGLSSLFRYLSSYTPHSQMEPTCPPLQP